MNGFEGLMKKVATTYQQRILASIDRVAKLLGDPKTTDSDYAAAQRELDETLKQAHVDTDAATRAEIREEIERRATSDLVQRGWSEADAKNLVHPRFLDAYGKAKNATRVAHLAWGKLSAGAAAIAAVVFAVSAGWHEGKMANVAATDLAGRASQIDADEKLKTAMSLGRGEMHDFIETFSVPQAGAPLTQVAATPAPPVPPAVVRLVPEAVAREPVTVRIERPPETPKTFDTTLGNVINALPAAKREEAARQLSEPAPPPAAPAGAPVSHVKDKDLKIKAVDANGEEFGVFIHKKGQR